MRAIFAGSNNVPFKTLLASAMEAPIGLKEDVGDLFLEPVSKSAQEKLISPLNPEVAETQEDPTEFPASLIEPQPPAPNELMIDQAAQVLRENWEADETHENTSAPQTQEEDSETSETPSTVAKSATAPTAASEATPTPASVVSGTAAQTAGETAPEAAADGQQVEPRAVLPAQAAVSRHIGGARTLMDRFVSAYEDYEQMRQKDMSPTERELYEVLHRERVYRLTEKFMRMLDNARQLGFEDSEDRKLTGVRKWLHIVLGIAVDLATLMVGYVCFGLLLKSLSAIVNYLVMRRRRAQNAAAN
ncbi:putative transmembrane protein [Gregarina niphandrodes]|uniref:Transmembrane protein n=1 Tax=Gregarina niphandrodes TaxID=110365 RepID=A0A023BD84_GRENI|nr:putative transmembrane protein [Gregarina niphandrodes]EZG87453.1 putative transmembrane protein [Gregarina niphandrodes]|eukprot:XP_011128658.1 putative transmembrane protein [Gregarina niphandrodes]